MLIPSDAKLLIRILIADSSPVICDGVRSLIERQPDLEVVGVALDGEDAYKKTAELLPDVVIMDARMPTMGGVAVTRWIKEGFPNVGVLFFSVFMDCIQEAMAVGSDGYLVKDCGREDLFSEVRRIAAKQGVG